MLSRLRARAGLDGPPRLSAVMPVHDVAAYLPATLRSVQQQTFTDWELVVVDDGSTDTTADVVRRVARTDRRVRLVQQPNAGQSAARNRAVELVTGELLTFVDGDDLLPPDAWALLVGSLEESGSDFAVGTMERMGDDGLLGPTRRMRDNHAVAMRGARIEHRPELLADVWLFDKVFRLDFWRREGLELPVGMIYEDQPVMTQAFLAGTFDVLTETVYHYRVRGDGSSSSQSRHTLRDLQDRSRSKQMTLAAVRAHGDDAVTRALLVDVLPVDLWEYFRASVSADADYRAQLGEMVRGLWHEGTVPFWRTDVPVRQRLMGFLVAHDRWEDLARLVEGLDAGAVAVVEQDGRRVLDHPWRDEPGMPPECTEAGPAPL